MNERSAWERAFVRASHVHDTLVAAQSRAIDALTGPDHALDPASRYVAAFAGLHAEVRYALKDVEALRAETSDMVAQAIATSALRPLEAVIADIEAAGHTDIDLGCYGAGLNWRCRTRLEAPEYPGEGSTRGALATWREASEVGDASGKTPTEAAEARLAQIRALHAEQAARSIGAASHELAIGETSVGDTRPLLIDPTDTIADAFAARRMDDDPAGESAWAAVERSYDAAHDRAGDANEGGEA